MADWEELPRALGEVVRARRRELGISQAVLAKRSGLHPSAVSSIEREGRNAALPMLERLAKGLDWPVSTLVERAMALAELGVLADPADEARLLRLEGGAVHGEGEGDQHVVAEPV
jgi:transcriptional regulator with XRE-family HTH domain